MQKVRFGFAILILTAFCSGTWVARGQSTADSHTSTEVAAADSGDISSSSAQSQARVSATGSEPEGSVRPFSTAGVGVTISFLGIGIEGATPLSSRTNLRVGANFFGLSESFSSDGINYAGSLTLRSFDALYDWFPFNGGFHLSPGLMFYNGNQFTANLSVPGGSGFTVNDTSYLSSTATPVTGTGSLKFNRVAPMVLTGWGNVVPRRKHLSVPFEVGIVFQGTPQVALNFTGNVCDSTGQNCRAISSDPSVQANIQAQQAKFNKDVNPYKFLPVISTGVAYRF